MIELFRARTWSELRSIGNSRLIQVSAVFPIVGYLILFSDEVSNFLSMRHLPSLPQSGFLDSLWQGKLYFVYFGLMLLGLGSLIYQVACPFIIKKHGDYTDYVRVDGDALSFRTFEKMGKAASIPYAASRDKSGSISSELMQANYEIESRSKQIARLCVTCLFYTGFAILAVPSLLTAMKVVALLIRGRV
jgi:hypothetical protein